MVLKKKVKKTDIFSILFKKKKEFFFLLKKKVIGFVLNGIHVIVK